MTSVKKEQDAEILTEGKKSQKHGEVFDNLTPENQKKVREIEEILKKSVDSNEISQNPTLLHEKNKDNNNSR